MTARQLPESLNLPLRVRSTQQVLQRVEYLGNKNLKQDPALTPMHKENRISWSCNLLPRRVLIWQRTIISDENRIFIDGIDILAYYWVHKRLEEKQFRDLCVEVVASLFGTHFFGRQVEYRIHWRIYEIRTLRENVLKQVRAVHRSQEWLWMLVSERQCEGTCLRPHNEVFYGAEGADFKMDSAYYWP